MIKTIIKSGIIRWLKKHEMTTKDGKDLTIINYIVRDIESEKSKGSLVCVHFINEKNVTPLALNDIVTVSGNLFERFAKDSNGKFLKDEKGKLVSAGFEMHIEKIEKTGHKEDVKKTVQKDEVKKNVQKDPKDMSKEELEALLAAKKAIPEDLPY